MLEHRTPPNVQLWRQRPERGFAQTDRLVLHGAVYGGRKWLPAPASPPFPRRSKGGS